MVVTRTLPRGRGDRLRWLALGAVSFSAQLLVVQLLGPDDVGTPAFTGILATTHLILLPFLLRNLRFWGIRLILVGLALNLFVMTVNGGLMPVETSAVEAVNGTRAAELEPGPIPGTKNRLMDRDEIRARQLADVIVLPLPGPLARAASAGDLLIAAGAALAFAQVARSQLSREVGRQQRTER